MIKYYTRAFNFYYGKQAKLLIKKRIALPLCGSKDIAFDNVDIFERNNGKVSIKRYHIKNIKNISINKKKKILSDLKKIVSKRKNFIKNVNFANPIIMGILNLTPDSFSDGGQYNKKNKYFKHISKMIKDGADIIEVGGESTRPGSKTISSQKEWKRVENVIKIFKKKYKKVCLSLDTRKSDLMIKGIKNGVDLINDVSGFNYEKDSLIKLRDFKIAKVLHHNATFRIVSRSVGNRRRGCRSWLHHFSIYAILIIYDTLRLCSTIPTAPLAIGLLLSPSPDRPFPN